MADEEHWAQRRQRAAKCKIHGLHYDPRLTSGCALCRKEAPAAPRQRPQMVLMLLSLLGVAVCLYRVFGPDSVRADSETAAPPTTPAAATAAVSGRLAPEPYRASIEAAEQALFHSAATRPLEMGDQIVIALGQLQRDLVNRQQGEEAVATLGELSDRVTVGPFSLELLASLRDEWTRLRGRTFQSAPWFAVPSRINPSNDRAALVTYRAAADDLFYLLDEGAGRARELLTPPSPNLFDREDLARSREAWRSFRTDWGQRIVDLRRGLPTRPGANADPQVLLATQRLEDAFARVSALAAGDLPSQTHVDAAFDAAEQARRSFDELLLQ